MTTTTVIRPFGRDWLEDADRAFGDYYITCESCRETFVGHKRRRICRACAKAIAEGEMDP